MNNKSSLMKKNFDAKYRCIRLSIYTAIIIVINFVLYKYHRNISIAGFIITVIYFCFEIHTIGKSRKQFIDYIENLDFCLNAHTRGSLMNFPNPLIITDFLGNINWYNEPFKKAIGNAELFDNKIHNLIPELQISKLIELGNKADIELKIRNNVYAVWANIVKSNDDKIDNGLLVIYFIDRTEEKRLQKLRDDESIVECVVIVDNYDEVLKETPNSNHGILMGEIEQKINDWVMLGNGVSRKYEKDKYIIFFESRNFEKIEKTKFELLDEIRNINMENKIPVTLSIGIGRNGVDPEENDKFARLAIDMALGRGGDQVVIKSSDKFSFFGAKTREVERRTKVKARVMAHALGELIDHSSNVIIMGHKNGDMDSIGASIGLYKAVMSRNKKAFIVLDRASANAKTLIDEFVDEPNYIETFISGEQALNVYEKHTLLVMVDTHRPSMVEKPELIAQAENIVLIDHHRRGEEFVQDTVLVYHEPYASSTCEMITEILQYIQDNERLTKKEAEALYAGIVMDTKGFTVKTGVRTFEAASYLRRMGIDIVNVRRLFKSDIENYMKKAAIISTAKIYHDNIAISFLDQKCKDMQIIVAQAADELLDINSVEASFVLTRMGNKVLISGRSLDSINVQVILEKLGGGGHITIAGAQVESDDMYAVEEMLKNAIDEVLES